MWGTTVDKAHFLIFGILSALTKRKDVLELDNPFHLPALLPLLLFLWPFHGISQPRAGSGSSCPCLSLLCWLLGFPLLQGERSQAEQVVACPHEARAWGNRNVKVDEQQGQQAPASSASEMCQGNLVATAAVPSRGRVEQRRYWWEEKVGPTQAPRWYNVMGGKMQQVLLLHWIHYATFSNPPSLHIYL